MIFSLLNCCPDELFCLKCSENKDGRICAKCEDRAFDTNSKLCQVPSQKIKNCKIYEDGPEKKCATCNFGFGLANDETECKPCLVKNCAICNEDQKTCNGCFGTKVLSTDEKGYYCFDDPDVKTAQCQVNLKKLGEINERCQLCKEGFSSDEEKRCVKEPSKNCWKVAKGRCVLCRYGYYEDSRGECLPNMGFWSVAWLIFKYLLLLSVIGGFLYFLFSSQKRKRVLSLPREPLVT